MNPQSEISNPKSQKLTRRVLESLPLTPIHVARNWSKADVSELEWPVGSGQRVVVKDFKKRARWFRILAARPMLRREARALRVLAGIEGIPKLIAYPDADCIALEKMSGIQLEECERNSVPHNAVLTVDELIAKVHERGVTHGDLHHENILIEGERIALIDWATACVFRISRQGQVRGPRAWLYEEFKALDRRALAKVKLFHARALMTEGDYDLLENGSRAYRSVKRLRYKLDALRGKQNSDRLEKVLKKVRARAEAKANEAEN